MNLRVEVIVVPLTAGHGLFPAEWFEHLFDLLLKSFDQGRFILDTHVARFVQVIPLDRLPLPLSLEKTIEEAGVRILAFYLFGFQIDDLTQLVYIF